MTLSNTNLKKEINKIIWALKFNVIPIKNKKLKDKPVIVQKRKKRKKKRRKKEKLKLVILIIKQI